MKAALRAAVAAGLTAFILWKSHPREVLAALAHADWRLIAVAVLLVIVDRALMAYRWVVLLCIIDPAERPRMSEVYACLGCCARCGRCAQAIKRIMDERPGSVPASPSMH